MVHGASYAGPLSRFACPTMEMHPVFLFLDPYLIWFYRITGHARIDFILGTFTLALMAVIIGELNIALAYLAARRRIERAHR